MQNGKTAGTIQLAQRSNPSLAAIIVLLENKINDIKKKINKIVITFIFIVNPSKAYIN